MLESAKEKVGAATETTVNKLKEAEVDKSKLFSINFQHTGEEYAASTMSEAKKAFLEGREYVKEKAHDISEKSSEVASGVAASISSAAHAAEVGLLGKITWGLITKNYIFLSQLRSPLLLQQRPLPW